jgi:S1/P1 nuclease
MRRISAVALAAWTIAHTPACAWYDFAHMQTAAIAWSRLTPAARARASQLLELNPMYAAWTRNVPARERDQIAFMMAATWPDAIKRLGDYHADGPADGERPPPEPQASQNIGYADHSMHKYWHFINEPFSPDGTPLRDPQAPNAQTQIAAFRAKLSDPNASDELKSYDLVWLLHLVGDVHQPLHAATRFTRAFPDGDAGGTRVRIQCGEGCDATDLHAFWDGAPGTSENPHDAIKAANELPAPDARLASIADEKAWIEESLKAAKTDVYAPPIRDGAGPFALTDRYKSAALAIAKQRIALAGARLANLLNAALK